MFFVQTFQGTKLVQKISYLGKVPSFLRAASLPSSCKPTLTDRSWKLHLESRSGGSGTACAQPGTEKQLWPQPARFRADPGIFPMHRKRTDSPGLCAASSPAVQPAPEEPSSFALYFQSCSLLAAHLCTEHSRGFAPSFYN